MPNNNMAEKHQIKMSLAQRLGHEIKVVGLTTLYFALWLGMLILLKKLILSEYQIEFYGLSMALIGALIVAKVVLVMEHIPLGAWLRQQAAWQDVILRTALYGLGVLVVLLLEKAFEARHEYGGFGPALTGVFQHADIPHVWASAIGVTAALLVFNVLSVIRRHLGAGGLLRLLLSPLPEDQARR